MTPTTQAGATSASDPVTILYTNWRGETAVRRIIIPVIIGSDWMSMALRFKSNEWHPEPQWLLAAYDVEKEAGRDFALSGIKAWGQEAVDAALAAELPSPAVVPESVRRDQIEALARSIAAEKIGSADPTGARLPEDIWWQALPEAKRRMANLIADAPPSGRAAEGGEHEPFTSTDAVRHWEAEQAIAQGEPVTSTDALALWKAEEALVPTTLATAGDVPGSDRERIARLVYEEWLCHGQKPNWVTWEELPLISPEDYECCFAIADKLLATAPAAPEPAAGGETLSLSPEAKPTKGFPNRAGHPNPDDELAAELEAAGIEVHRLEFMRDARSEVQTAVRGSLHGWSFTRAWYYWVASGPGIELAAADILHAAHPATVRVAGHCGCPTPLEWFNGFAVGSYHVDSPAGLKGLADTIRHIARRAAPPSTPTRADAGAEGRRA